MPVNRVHCHVLKGDVTVISDINGTVKNIVCPEYNRRSGWCELKQQGKGLLERLLDGLDDVTVGTRQKYCEFVELPRRKR